MRYHPLYEKNVHYDNRPYELLRRNPEYEQMVIHELLPTAKERHDTIVGQIDKIDEQIEELMLAKTALWNERIGAVNQMKIEGDYERER